MSAKGNGDSSGGRSRPAATAGVKSAGRGLPGESRACDLRPHLAPDVPAR